MALVIGQIVGGHYQIIRALGSGGFGQTYLAKDQYLPGTPACVVKQLKPQATDPNTLQIARRLFETEAKVLYQLGNHDQIPRLFAYFEENQEFYLVQEFVEGHNLSQELPLGTQLSEAEVSTLLQDILEILIFVHQQNVIHRDINPHNLIRRQKDGKLVLIDFGAVKQVSTQLLQPGGQNPYTVAIGTPGFLSSEQANGSPKLSSDIYAVGMIGIQALTGVFPHQFAKDPDTDEIIWQNQAQVSPEFAKVLDKMVRYDFRQRYHSAEETLQALKSLTQLSSATLALQTVPASKPPVAGKKPTKVRSKPWKILILLFLIGVGITAGVSIVNTLNFASATDLYKQGETFLDLKRYQEALTAYKKALKIRPDYLEAWAGQGDALFHLKQSKEALDAYDKAIQIQPDYLEAWRGRGYALTQLQRFEEAVDSFNKALEIQSEDPESWKGQGDVLISLKRYEEAVKSYDQAVKFQSKDEQAWYKRGWALHNLQKYTDAVSSFDKALELKSDYAQAWYHRGNSLINQERYQEATESYDKVVQFQPEFYQAWHSKGNTLLKLQQYKEAIAAYDQVIKNKSDFYEAWYNKGWALHQLQRYEEAVNAYDRVLQIKRNDYLAAYNRGNALYSLKRYEKAITSYQRAVQIKPEHYESWYSLGNTLVNLKRYSEAIAAYDKAIQYKPDYQKAIESRKQAQEAQLKSDPVQSQDEKNSN